MIAELLRGGDLMGLGGLVAGLGLAAWRFGFPRSGGAVAVLGALLAVAAGAAQCGR